MDAADIARKLALVVRDVAKPSLLDSYAVERGIADHHVLEVSDEIHSFVMNLVAMWDRGALAAPDAARDMAAARRRSMLDISHAARSWVGPVKVSTDYRPERASPLATTWRVRATI